MVLLDLQPTDIELRCSNVGIDHMVANLCGMTSNIMLLHNVANDLVL